MNLLLEHANITVRSTEESVRFLTAAFPEFRIRGGGYLHGKKDLGHWAHIGNDDTYLALQENAEHRARQDSPYGNDGINHLGFVVEKVDELMNRLKDAGYKPSDESSLKGNPNRRRVYYVDGNDFEWEFVEYLTNDLSKRNEYDSLGPWKSESGSGSR